MIGIITNKKSHDTCALILGQPHGSISLPQESLSLLSQGTSLSSKITYPVLQEEEVPLSKRACYPSDISCTPPHQSHTTYPQHKEPFDQVHFKV